MEQEDEEINIKKVVLPGHNFNFSNSELESLFSKEDLHSNTRGDELSPVFTFNLRQPYAKFFSFLS